MISTTLVVRASCPNSTARSVRMLVSALVTEKMLNTELICNGRVCCSSALPMRGLQADVAVARHDDDGAVIEPALDVGFDDGTQVRQPRFVQSRVAHTFSFANRLATYRLSMYSRMAKILPSLISTAQA